jgi:high-affinity K+ transport system ATPase subunit B
MEAGSYGKEIKYDLTKYFAFVPAMFDFCDATDSKCLDMNLFR